MGIDWQSIRFVVICKKFSRQYVKAVNGSCTVKKLFQIKNSKKKQLQNTLKQLKSNIKRLNSCNLVKIIMMLSNNFHHMFWLLYRNIFLKTSFLRASLVGYLFYPKLFFDKWIGRSFNISNSITSRSQVLSQFTLREEKSARIKECGIKKRGIN